MNSFHYVYIQQLCFCKKKRRPTVLIVEDGQGEITDLLGWNLCVSCFLHCSLLFVTVPQNLEGKERKAERKCYFLYWQHCLCTCSMFHPFFLLSPTYSIFRNCKRILGPCQG